MSVNQKLRLDIRSLIFLGRVRITDLNHTVAARTFAIHAHRQVIAFYIYHLPRLVIVVETVLAHLYLHSACLVLDIETLVEIAGLVSSGHATPYDDFLAYELVHTDYKRAAFIFPAKRTEYLVNTFIFCRFIFYSQ